MSTGLKTIYTGLSADATAKRAKAGTLHESLTPGNEYTSEIQVDLRIGDPAEDRFAYFCEQFGESVCISQMVQRIVHNMQTTIRNLMAKGLDDDAIQAQIFDLESDNFIWKINAPRVKKSVFDRAEEAIVEMSPEEKEAAKAKAQRLLELLTA